MKQIRWVTTRHELDTKRLTNQTGSVRELRSELVYALARLPRISHDVAAQVETESKVLRPSFTVKLQALDPEAPSTRVFTMSTYTSSEAVSV